MSAAWTRTGCDDGPFGGLASRERTCRRRGSFWRDAAQWAKAHPEDGDAGTWRVENAAARLAADRLHAMGLPVAIAYAEPEA